jgi:hypothetical protein
MSATSNESLFFTALLVFFGVLALYGGARWLEFLIPAAVMVWLAASARGLARRPVIDARVDNKVGR